MILNAQGFPASSKFLDSSSQRPNRPRNQSPAPRDWDDLISSFDHKTVVGRSRKLYSNNGIVRAVINQKAMFTVGNAWNPQPLSKDIEWNSLVTDYLDKLFRVIEVRGHNWWDVLFMSSVMTDRDGDCAIILTSNKSGGAAIQLISAHNIGSRDESKKTVESGSYKGFKIVKGCVLNKQGRAIAFHILGDTEADDKYVSENDIIFIKEPEYVESVRGTTLFGHCINDFGDMSEATKREMTAMLMHSSHVFNEHRSEKGINIDDPDSVASCGSNKPYYEEFSEGMIIKLNSDANEKIESLVNHRPGVEWRLFHDRIERACIVGCNWSRALLDVEGFSSVDNRMALRICEISVKDRQNLLLPVAQRIVAYAVAKAIKNGVLPYNEDWYKFKFSFPPYITVDPSRFDASTRANLDAGITTMTEICESKGTNVDQHVREREEEKARAILIRRETEAKYGLAPNSLDIPDPSKSL